MSIDAEHSQFLRSALSTKESAKPLFDSFIEEAIKNQQHENGEQRIAAFFEHALRTMAFDSVDAIYLYSESEIEKVFLGSLLLCLIRGDPLSLRFTAPLEDAPNQISAWRQAHESSVKLWDAYVTDGGGDPIGGFETWLSTQEAVVGHALPFKKDVVSHAVNHQLGFCQHYAFTMQAGFPEIRVGGRSIRADLLVWIPEKPACRIIVECDGYDYHKDKDRFTSDRQRDRALKLQGYDVLRYSGSEIYRRPVETSFDFFNVLLKWEHGDA
jgi:hypothetical protein